MWTSGWMAQLHCKESIWTICVPFKLSIPFTRSEKSPQLPYSELRTHNCRTLNCAPTIAVLWIAQPQLPYSELRTHNCRTLNCAPTIAELWIAHPQLPYPILRKKKHATLFHASKQCNEIYNFLLKYIHTGKGPLKLNVKRFLSCVDPSPLFLLSSIPCLSLLVTSLLRSMFVKAVN
jgi:hypothetical protein